MKCHQRKIRDSYVLNSPVNKIVELKFTAIHEINKDEAAKVIMKYEWLKTMGRPVVCYGLYFQNELVGALNFGRPTGPFSADICGKELREKAICLERGACVHWTPKNTPSSFISRAIKIAHQTYGWEIFFAYCDEDAGEIGTIYQACNWYYLGQGIGRKEGRKREYFETPDGKIISERTLVERGLKKQKVLTENWKVHYKSPKHKYVWFEGSNSRKRELYKLCRYIIHPYPKRSIISES